MYNAAHGTQSYAVSSASYFAPQQYSLSQPRYHQQAASFHYERSPEQLYSASTPEQHAAFIANVFLNPERPTTPIISVVGEVKEVIEQTYMEMTGQSFPWQDIKLAVLPPQHFKQAYEATGTYYSDGIMGFSFNKYGKGISEIYVKEDHLDSLLLTIGHEIGHILSPTLHNAQDEEAKAHAFSIAWMETIRDNNIAGLQPNIRLNPARNGLHDVAYDFVLHLQQTGATAFDIFTTLSQGLTSIVAGVDA